MAIYVSRKDNSEASENVIRRFNRRVLQSGLVPAVKETMRFKKPLSKRDRRLEAIVRDERRARKAEQIKLGLR